MHAELLTNVLAADDKSLKTKSVTGRFPVLETKDGVRVAESLSIAKYLSRDHTSFYGSLPEQSK
jgi:glutathione S-transferase